MNWCRILGVDEGEGRGGSSSSRAAFQSEQGHHMNLPLLASMSGGFIALWSILYFVLLVTLGVISIRKGHWVMFIVGIFLPLFWFIGALMPRRVR
jgi:hypothetical protein